MADIQQVYSIVNDVAKEAFGVDAVKTGTALETSFVDIGATALSSETNIDAWYKTLIDRIGRTVMAIRAYEVNDDIHHEPFEFGAVLQKLSVKLPTATTNTTWNGQKVKHSDPFQKSEMEIIQTLFSKIATWEVDGTIPDVQLQTAFTSAEAMGAFIDGILMAMQNSMNADYENMSNLCKANFIALASAGERQIHLLTEYQTASGSSTILTPSAAMMDLDFLKYFSMRLKLMSDRMERMSVTFNNGTVQRHTPKEVQVINVLSEFSNAFDTYLQSDTYHQEITALPYYRSIPYWQGSGKTWSFDDTATVNITQETGGTPIVVPNVIAAIFDRDALGVTIDKRRTKSIYNPKDEYTNYFMKCEIGYYNDMSENGIIFTLD